MLVVLRFSTTDDLLPLAQPTLRALAAQRGFVRGSFGRAVDDPTAWALVLEWESVGAYRRALGAYEVKVAGTILLSRALPEASAYEPLLVATTDGEITARASDRALGPG